MNIVLFVTIVGVLALACIVWSIRGRNSDTRNPNGLASQLQPIDICAFRNLIDDGEREYLRNHLFPPDFRGVHRERMLAATEYVWCAFRNSGILIQLGEASRNATDPAVAATAASLVENATRLRLDAMQTLPKIYLSMVFPGLTWTAQDLPEGFDKLTRQAVILGCLQVPAQVAL